MSIKVGQAFERTSAQPIDTSLTLTKAGMLAVNDNLMPAYYFTICQDDGAIYLYDKTAAPTVTTGKFKKFEGGSSSGADIHSTTATLNDEINGTETVLAADLPGTSISDLTIGSSIIKDDKGTLGLVTAINGTTDITVTTATTSTPVKELTQAEYDVLTQAEKDNGTIYFITDGKFPGTVLSAHETIYTETERVVGSYMGKPLYQRTWKSSTVQVISNSSWGQQFSIPKAGMEQIIKCIGNGKNSNGGQAWQFMANLDSSATYVSFMASRDGDTCGSTEVTLQYTKTTDTASPVDYATPNDYSTSEKIVGSWVDGKPIYQKTLHLTTSDFIGSWPFKYYSLASLNMDKIISAPKGCFYYNNVTWVNIPDIEVASSGFNGDYTATWTVRANSTDRELLLCAQNQMQSRIGEMYVTIQYTKSTD